MSRPAPAKIDWWGLFHSAMANLNWPAATVASHTIPQILCLLSEKSPSEGSDSAAIDTPEAWVAAMERRRREHEEWAIPAPE